MTAEPRTTSMWNVHSSCSSASWSRRSSGDPEYIVGHLQTAVGTGLILGRLLLLAIGWLIGRTEVR